MTPADRARVIAEAARWLGTPYHSGARVLGAGVDCAHLLIAVYHASALIPDVQPEAYVAQWYLHRDVERLLLALKDHAHETRDPEPGDIVTYRFGRAVAHAGILVAPGEIIHAREPGGVVRDAIDFMGADRYAGAWTIGAPQAVAA